MSYQFESSDPNPVTRKSFTCNLLCAQCSAQTVAGHQCRRTTCKYLPFCHSHLKSILGLRIADSRILAAGSGLFATRAIPNGTEFPYYGEALTRTELNRIYGTRLVAASPYSIAYPVRARVGRRMVNTSNFVDGACIRSAPVYANDVNTNIVNNPVLSLQYNAELQTSNSGPRRVFIRTIRNIAANEEIYVDYGRNYWMSHPAVNITRSRKIRHPTRPAGNPSPPAPL